MSRLTSLLMSLLMIIQSPVVYADALFLSLPQPGARVVPSSRFDLPTLCGMLVHPDEPLRFDFLINRGDDSRRENLSREEGQKLVDYFLAAMTVPRRDLWVNLSPVERQRIMPDNLVQTELGGIFLEQDYILKQFTASLIYPEEAVGRRFWDEVYAKAMEVYGTTDIPVDTFNKVWIEPDSAVAVEKGNAVYLTSLHLKVMLEADYLAKSNNALPDTKPTGAQEDISREVLRDIVIPVIEKEVNEGRNFAPLRQAMYPLALAQWYQQRIKESILNRAYSSRSKIAGIDLSDPLLREQVYRRYMEAYRKGVFDYVREDASGPRTDDVVARRYFSGGVNIPEINFKPGDHLPADAGAPALMRVMLTPKAAEPAPGYGLGMAALGVLLANASQKTEKPEGPDDQLLLIDGNTIGKNVFIRTVMMYLDRFSGLDVWVDGHIRHFLEKNRYSLPIFSMGVSSSIAVAVMAGYPETGLACLTPLMLMQVFLIGAQYKLRRMNERQAEEMKAVLREINGQDPDPADVKTGSPVREDPSQKGGIDAGNLALERRVEGDIQPLVSDRGLEQMISDAPGLRGVIIDIRPIR